MQQTRAKTRFNQSSGATTQIRDRPSISVTTDDKAGTITITDTGLGMTHGELVENLGTIAHSGTKAFLKQLAEAKKPDVGLIGQFGVGFYSAFMVAKRVTVLSRSFVPEEQGWQWTSEGGGGYELAPAADLPRVRRSRWNLRTKRRSSPQESTIERIIQRYSSFVPFPIELNTKRLNTVQNHLGTQQERDQRGGIQRILHVRRTRSRQKRCSGCTSADAPLAIQALLFVPARNFESMGMGRLIPK